VYKSISFIAQYISSGIITCVNCAQIALFPVTNYTLYPWKA